MKICIFVFVLLLLVGIIFVFQQSNIDEYGYGSNLNEISVIKEEKIFSSELNTEEDLFFYRTGYLTNFTLYIIGKFSSDTISKIKNNHLLIDLPKPLFSYEEQVPINTFSWPLKHIPGDIANKLKLRREYNNYFSELNDNIILFEVTKNKYYIQLFVLGESGYFIISITHATR